MKLTHSWHTSRGLKVTVTCKLVLSETIYADGDNVTVPTCQKLFKIEVEGMGVAGTYLNRTPKQVDGETYPASCGKLVISQDNLNAIDSMVAEIKSHPAWVAKETRESAAAEIERDYEAHYAKMQKIMGY